MKQDEQALLKGARLFDRQALETIYDRYSAPLYHYAARLLGDSTLAEECVSETFTRFLKALRQGQGPEQYLQAYLYRIAHNWITDCYRRERTPQELDEHTLGEDGGHPADVAGQRMEQALVRAALLRLTPEQRQVILLHFMEGWPIEEIAAALQKSAGAVKALQSRALASLRKLLELEEGELQDEEPAQTRI